jgi:AcrR family transcriptional regulator
MLESTSIEEISLRKLCKQVGVTPGNFYNHYQNLEDLFAHLSAQFFNEFRERVTAARTRHRKPLNRLKAGAREFVHIAIDKPVQYRLLYGGNMPSLLMKYEVFLYASEEAFRQTVIEIYGEDLYRKDDHAWSQKNLPHAYAYFALINGIARDVIDGLVEFESKDDIDLFVDRLIDSFLGGKAFKDLSHRL